MRKRGQRIECRPLVYGLFCVSARAATYRQGALVATTVRYQSSPGATLVSASGGGISLSARSSQNASTFTESAPVVASGTFTTS